MQLSADAEYSHGGALGGPSLSGQRSHPPPPHPAGLRQLKWKPGWLVICHCGVYLHLPRCHPLSPLLYAHFLHAFGRPKAINFVRGAGTEVFFFRDLMVFMDLCKALTSSNVSMESSRFFHEQVICPAEHTPLIRVLVFFLSHLSPHTTHTHAHTRIQLPVSGFPLFLVSF